jgi:hypothetical protein
MTDWIEHDGGPQPVADDVWVHIDGIDECPANEAIWAGSFPYRVLNQHLIDAARIEGIRLGLEAAAIVAGSRIGYPRDVEMRASIRRLDPEAIAKETAR